jgi:hypothetical protein
MIVEDVGLEIQNLPAGEIVAQGAVVQFPCKPATHPDGTGCTPQAITVGLASVTVPGVQFADVAV